MNRTDKPIMALALGLDTVKDDTRVYPTGHVRSGNYIACPAAYLEDEAAHYEVPWSQSQYFSIIRYDVNDGEPDPEHIFDVYCQQDAIDAINTFLLLEDLACSKYQKSYMEDSAETVISDFNRAVMTEQHPYHSLAVILLKAFEQAAHGKGQVRHNTKDEPFEQQPMQKISRLLNNEEGLHYQIFKKLLESRYLDPNGMHAERLGAINYIAGSIIYQAGDH